MKKKQGTSNEMREQQTLLMVAFCSFLGGALVAGAVAVLIEASRPATNITGLRESDITTASSTYTFIDPLIAVRGGNNSPKYAAMQKQVADYIASQKSSGLITASVDFRNMNQSGGFVINGTEQYTPASLNKVPVMMAYYKLAEANPGILDQEITYPVSMGDHNSVEEIRSAVDLRPGTAYTIEELIEHMIRYSDNNAADLLTQHLQDTGNLGTYTAVFADLGINPSVLENYTDNMTVQNYSIFLRALYNATYLSRDDSERALRLLSETDFTAGIESGVPNNVLIGQKFGEVRITNNNGTLLGKELNNCGIIYYPGHPYLLCVMTKATGDNIPLLESEIASISSIVYKNMQTLYP